MVRQINRKAEIIEATMREVWDKLDELESAYHDMLMKAMRLQSNKVCKKR